MYPELKFIVNPLFINFLNFEKNISTGTVRDDFSLTLMNHLYNDGLKGYFISKIGESSTVDDFEILLDEFKEDFLASIKKQSLNEDIHSEQYENCRKYHKIFSDFWHKKGTFILERIADVFNDTWEEKSISVFISTSETGFIAKSNPLILPIYKDSLPYNLQILVHELIHRHAAFSKDNSLYSIITTEGKKRNINSRETYRRIIHPLMFFFAWYVIAEIFPDKVVPFYKEQIYIENVEKNILVVKKLVSTLKNTIEDYYNKKTTMIEFVNSIYNEYSF